MARGGRGCSRLKRSIVCGLPLSRIYVDNGDVEFLNEVMEAGVVTIFHYDSMKVVSVRMDDGVQTLEIEPFQNSCIIPEGSVISTLNGKVRLPLAHSIKPGDKIEMISLRDICKGEVVTFFNKETRYDEDILIVDETSNVKDIVYLDDNFLVYSGEHTVNIVRD